MNKHFNGEELSEKILALLEEKRAAEGVALCNEAEAGCSTTDDRIFLLLLRAGCHAAAGSTDLALEDHRLAFELGYELPAAEHLGIAEDALKARLPFDYCAEIFMRAGERFVSEGDDLALAAGALNKAGICHFRNGSPTEKEKDCFYRALGVMELCDDEDDRLQILTALIMSNLAECLAREGECDEAVDMYCRASEVFVRHLDGEDRMCLTHYAICQRCLSDLYRRREENIQAHTCLSRSISELERRADSLPEQLRLHLAVCYNARGTLRFQMGNYEGEVDDCTRSLQLREGLDSEVDALATVVANRGEAYAMLGRTEQAREDYLHAIDLLDSIPENTSAAVSAATRFYALGQLYTEAGQHPEAAEAFRSAARRIASVRSRRTEDAEYTAEQLADIESLARMRLSAAIYSCGDRDFFDSAAEAREAIRLLEGLPLTVERAARLSALHFSMGELMETFDETEAAEAEYDLAEDYREQGIALAVSDMPFDDSDTPFDNGEEYEYEQLQNESSIWEDFSDDTPQG